MKIKLGSLVLQSDSLQAQEKLEHAYARKERPLCLCKGDAASLEMYLAKVGESVVIKRMPNTGHKHSGDCEHYAPPFGIGGLSEVLGQAIYQDNDGKVCVKLDVKLSFRGKKPAVEKTVEKDSGQEDPNGPKSADAKSDPKKLTLGSLFDRLCDEKLVSWRPEWSGKRSYGVWRDMLMQVASDMYVGGSRLSDILYIPEPWLDGKDQDILRRFNKQTGQTRASGPKTNLMVVVGELKALDTAQFGYKAVFKHMPSRPFFFDESLYNQLRKKFAEQFELRETLAEDVKGILIGTFFVSENGFPKLVDAHFKVVSKNWLPITDFGDFELQNILLRDRAYRWCPRYNCGSQTPIARAVLTDCDEPTAVFYVPSYATEDSRQRTVDTAIRATMPSVVVLDGNCELPPKKEVRNG